MYHINPPKIRTHPLFISAPIPSLILQNSLSLSLWMADMEPPSFSLGLDLDADSDPLIWTRIQSPPHTAPEASISVSFEEEEFGPQVSDSDPEPDSVPPRIHKRLRRGLVTKPLVFHNGVDEDIEDFSSQEAEDFIMDDHPPKHLHSVQSSSKAPLQGLRVSTTRSSRQWKARKMEQGPDCASVDTIPNGSTFPKLTISPIRKFQLIDSDSEDTSGSKDVSKTVHENKQQFTVSEQRRKVLAGKPQNEDLWKDFSPSKSLHIPTPALDEFCEEYSRSVKSKDAAQALGGAGASYINNDEGCHQITNSGQKFEQCWDLTDPPPPAHQYFFHDDPRIQKLVRTRLPNFFPLGVVNRGNVQSSASIIDYMSQFTDGEASKQKVTQKTNKNCSTMRNKSKKSNGEELLHAYEGWVDPRSSCTIPKDAGKRRVQATGQSAGRWYTGPNGRRVYVSRSGQELTGKMAYKHYRKENGGFRKSKKKTSGKKKKG
ncbi:hypothetical protein CFOL_v3_16419 [Cephalotus follicularis]|uniref:Uncharacterized protein n=1 Tax=Cephalotus follicularis TaxID=3775 RepID=A0A1Q3BYG8_CEPFO|nr:hypothetical protein CFOL_v3_16419 [Cephalotus follicularis]